MGVRIKIILLKLNLEYLIGCLNQLESYGNVTLLKDRAIDIIAYPVSEYFNNETKENLKWIVESTNNFIRFYPENIFNSGIEILDSELNRQYYFINSLIDNLSKELDQEA